MDKADQTTTIVRAPHDRQNPYKMVRQATFEDSRLSWEARGMLAYLLVKPDNWSISITNLRHEGDCGRDRVYRIIGELVKFGYLEKEELRDNGRFLGLRYLLHEEPIEVPPDETESVTPPLPENPDTVSPLPENTETVFPPPEKPNAENKEHTNNEDSTNSVTLTKNEGGGEAAQLAPEVLPAAPALPPPPSPPKKSKFFDDTKIVDGYVPAGQGSNPFECYLEIISLDEMRLKRIVFTRTIAEFLTAQIVDLNRWREAVRAWRLEDNKPGNFKGMVDWYHAGPPKRGQRAAPVAKESTTIANGLSLIEKYRERKKPHVPGQRNQLIEQPSPQ